MDVIREIFDHSCRKMLIVYCFVCRDWRKEVLKRIDVPTQFDWNEFTLWVYKKGNIGLFDWKIKNLYFLRLTDYWNNCSTASYHGNLDLIKHIQRNHNLLFSPKKCLEGASEVNNVNVLEWLMEPNHKEYTRITEYNIFRKAYLKENLDEFKLLLNRNPPLAKYNQLVLSDIAKESAIGMWIKDIVVYSLLESQDNVENTRWVKRLKYHDIEGFCKLQGDQ